MTSQQMSLTEARELLGLAAPTEGAREGAIPDALTLRKAYVRAIKRYSPESNPLEFQRVRAAYELLDSWREWGPDDDIASAWENSLGELTTASTATEATPDLPRGEWTPAPPPSTEAELRSILTQVDVMEEGRRARVSIPESSIERVFQLTSWGWPVWFDLPLVRFTARLFELGHTYDGHLLLERLLTAAESPPKERGGISHACNSRLVGIAKAVREKGESARLSWVFEPDPIERHPGRRQPRIDDEWISTSAIRAVLFIAFVALFRSSGLCDLAGSASSVSSARTPHQRVEKWMMETCRDTATLCDSARSLSQALLEARCQDAGLELTALGAVAQKRLSAAEAQPILIRAHKIARSQCPSDVARVPEASPVAP